jgi:protein tyrosine phosphatase (PTP) superfamily phosphohydrolase (DUF442 family)
MGIMKKRKRSHTGLGAIIVLIAATILLVRHFHIRDFRIIKPGALYVSGQPRRMDYIRLLYKYHIAAIVNIRPLSEHREENWHNEEIVFVRTNGIKYFEMPIDKADFLPDTQTQEWFLAIMANTENLPVLLHGGNADDKRVAMLVAVWLLKSQRYAFEQAVNEVKKIIDDRELTKEEIEFIGAMAKEARP